ncbi:MAG: hypothetical protein AABZ06_02375 [Bdellovibrionota bacterium]|mgnify:CR=1 FL=1
MKFKDIGRPIKRGQEILSELKKKFQENELDSYIVVSSRWGQIEVGTSPENALRTFPKLFLDSNYKTAALTILEQINKLNRKTTSVLSAKLTHAIAELDLDETVQIELRFGELRYDVVWALQKNPLVDQQLTPQSKSSIRIVLGTLRSLYPTGVIDD